MDKLFKIDKIIYDKLVEEENDILGIIAFSLYKKQQINWLENHDKIDDNTYSTFLSFVNTNQQIANYQEKAIELSKVFAKELYQHELNQINEVVNNDINKFKEKLDKEFEKRFIQKTEKFNPKFRTGVYQGIIASFAFTLLIGIIVFFSWSLQKGPKDIVENIFQVKITSIEKENPKQETNPLEKPKE